MTVLYQHKACTLSEKIPLGAVLPLNLRAFLSSIWSHLLYLLIEKQHIVNYFETLRWNLFQCRIKYRSTYTQHCRLVLGPPNLGLSRQFMHRPQSSSWLQPLHVPHLRERYPNGPSPFRFTKFDCFLTLATFWSDSPGLSDSEGDPTSATTKYIHFD